MIKEYISVIKQYPALCAAILIVGFALGALHNYFGL